STVALTYEGGRRYAFAVPEKELTFFHRATGLRTAPRPV
ncbi:MAG: ABC transporter ATP-binding protein, partial [Candidatus Rokuibacteriota bacterium]